MREQLIRSWYLCKPNDIRYYFGQEVQQAKFALLACALFQQVRNYYPTALLYSSPKIRSSTLVHSLYVPS